MSDDDYTWLDEACDALGCEGSVEWDGARAQLAALRARASSADALEAALALTVEALREIGDHRGLVAHHGDALDAGLKALAAAKVPGGAT